MEDLANQISAKLNLDPAPKTNMDALWVPHDLKGTEFGMVGITRADGGGVKAMDKEQMAKQRGVSAHLIKNIGANLLEGKSVINVSLPVRIFEPRSFLERMSDVWAYAPLYLNKAAQTKDPVERFKLVVTWLVAGLHRGTIQLKPFNPILGETFQGTYPDGSQIYCEQICHHPPISGFQVIGPQASWMFHGHHECTASFRPNGILAGQTGPNTLEFFDGTKITYNIPSMRISGILFGDRLVHYSDTLTFEDAANKLKCEIELNPDGLSGLRALVQTAKSPADTLRGTLTKNGQLLCEVTGSWIDQLSFGTQVYWKMGEYQPYSPTHVPSEKALPSDCRFRTDLSALLAGDEETSQKQKSVLEEEQRRYRKLRAKFNKDEEIREREYYRQHGSMPSTTNSESGQGQAQDGKGISSYLSSWWKGKKSNSTDDLNAAAATDSGDADPSEQPPLNRASTQPMSSPTSTKSEPMAKQKSNS